MIIRPKELGMLIYKTNELSYIMFGKRTTCSYTFVERERARERERERESERERRQALIFSSWE